MVIKNKELSVIVFFVALLTAIFSFLILRDVVFPWGDSLEFIAKCYSVTSCSDWEYNGRLSQALVQMILLVPLDLNGQIFFDYPWNWLRLLSLFLHVCAVLVSGFAISRLLEIKFNKKVAFFITFFTFLYLTTEEVHVLGAYFLIADLIAYSIPLFIFSIWLLLFEFFIKKIISSKVNLFSIALIAFFAIWHIFTLLLSEQHLIVLSVIPATYIYFIFVKGDVNYSRLLSIIFYFSVLTFVALYFYFTAPGQIARMGDLGVGLVINEDVIFRPVRTALNFVFGIHFVEVTPLLIDVMGWLYIFLICLIFYFLIKGYKENNESKLNLIILLMSILVYQSSFFTLFISNYFPNRAELFPYLLLYFILFSMFRFFDTKKIDS